MSKRQMMNDREIDGAIAENLRLGYVAKAGKNEAGEQLYRLTKKGSLWVERMISDHKPEAAP